MEDEVDGVNYTWNVAEKSEEDIDEKVGSTAPLEQHGDRRKEDGDDNLAEFCSSCHSVVWGSLRG